MSQSFRPAKTRVRRILKVASAAALTSVLLAVGVPAMASVATTSPVSPYGCDVSRTDEGSNFRYSFSCPSLPEGKEIMLRVRELPGNSDRVYQSGWASHQAPQSQTEWFASSYATSLDPRMTFYVADVGSSAPTSSFVYYDTLRSPTVDQPCSTGPRENFPCWTATRNVIVKLKVIDKNFENPTYFQVDRAGNRVDEGRFDTESTIWMPEGWTLVMEGHNGSIFDANEIIITSVQPY